MGWAEQAPCIEGFFLRARMARRAEATDKCHCARISFVLLLHLYRRLSTVRSARAVLRDDCGRSVPAAGVADAAGDASGSPAWGPAGLGGSAAAAADVAAFAVEGGCFGDDDGGGGLVDGASSGGYATYALLRQEPGGWPFAINRLLSTAHTTYCAHNWCGACVYSFCCRPFPINSHS
mmetsp:Transcript_165006/g.529728  ORF Transcript_165006/g.529728 Transcript_165006/m.529728 type:complete len:178 (+) Transcript_165006:1536-2069(+)